MKKVILIGDSIRMGYDKYIKESLADAAEVYYPSENCRFTTYILRFVHEWKKKGEWPGDADIVHWNAGLWDLPEILGDGPVTPIDHYADNIARIDRRLRLLFPKAKMVFATCTAVQEEKYGRDFVRRNSVIEQFNAAAIKALEGTDTIINDLYEITASSPESCHSDKTHYSTPDGIKLVGGKVLSVIGDAIGVTPNTVDMDTFYPENYSKKNIGN